MPVKAERKHDLKAVLMAGGQGTRLRPMTSTQPKPMVRVVNKPLMEHTLEHLKTHGFNDVVVTLQYLPTVITNYFGDGSAWDLRMRYAVEESPLGTAGSVRNAAELLDSRFLVISGDALTDIDLGAAIAFHSERGAEATVVLKKVPNPLDFGLVITDEDGRIVRFLEKPGWGEVFSDTINTGIYILEPELLNEIPPETPFDFSKDLFPRLLEEGRALFGHVANGYWADVGNHAQYLEVHRDILDGLVAVNVPGHRMENNIWIGDGADIHPKAKLFGPLFIGNHVKVEEGCKIREYSVLGDNVVIKRDNFVHRSIVMDNAYFAPSCHIRGSVIGRNCDIKSGVRIDDGAVLGDDCLIGENAIINPDVVVYPFKTVDPGATVNTSIIWESRGSGSLFGKRGLSGLINVDITPDMAVRLGMAYGCTLPINSQIVTSRDGTRAARIIKRAFIAGVNSAGVHCRDLEINTVPINRFTIESHGDQGGADIRSSERDPQWLDIVFFDENGRDLDFNARRNLERVYARSEFRRAFVDELGEIYYPARTRELYKTALKEKLDIERIKSVGFKIVFDYGYGPASLIMPTILGNLGCEVLSLNAFTDEKRMMSARPRLDEALETLGSVVENFSADLGLLFDNGAERLAVIDDRGRRLTGSDLLITMIELVTSHYAPPGKIVVPVDQPSVIERIAAQRGFEVVRSRVERSSIMNTAREERAIFAGCGDGSIMFCDFMYSFDAMMGFGMLLQMLAMLGEPLSAITGRLPAYFVCTRDVYTSWESKGTTMRKLIESNRGPHVDSTDGIKINWNGGRWVLVLPDDEEPVFHIIAEGKNEEDCQEILDEYEAFILEGNQG